MTKTEISVLYPGGVRDSYWPNGIESAKNFVKARNDYEGNIAVVQTREVTEWTDVNE